MRIFRGTINIAHPADFMTAPPRLSIITPSYNQAAYLEKTIQSVLDQKYPNLEYLIIDGGSTDGSVDIIRKYEKHLAFWVSEKDSGQCDAINKGLRKATGDIWAYLNSDDYYLPGAFDAVIKAFVENPAVKWVTGSGRYVDDSGAEVRLLVPAPFTTRADALIRWKGPRYPVSVQVANFMRREVIDACGYFDESLHYCMDFDFSLRLVFDGVLPMILPMVLANALLHQQSKTVAFGTHGAFAREDLIIIPRFVDRLAPDERQRVRDAVKYREFSVELQGCSRLAETEGKSAALARLFRYLASHPSRLFTRPVLGFFRQTLTGAVKKRSEH